VVALGVVEMLLLQAAVILLPMLQARQILAVVAVVLVHSYLVEMEVREVQVWLFYDYQLHSIQEQQQDRLQ
jgi:hypothetical protein